MRIGGGFRKLAIVDLLLDRRQNDGFVASIFATPAGSGFTVDVLVSSAVFWTFLFREAGIHGLRRPWADIALNLAVGLSCALPLFLYFRERAMAR